MLKAELRKLQFRNFQSMQDLVICDFETMMLIILIRAVIIIRESSEANSCDEHIAPHCAQFAVRSSSIQGDSSSLERSSQ